MRLFRLRLSTRTKLRELRKGSKHWWKLSRQLLNRPEATSNIPALRRPDKSWARTPIEKAYILLQSFGTKWQLPEPITNEYSDLPPTNICHFGFIPIRVGKVRKFINRLRNDSATGPDLLPARIIKAMAESLLRPILILIRLILKEGTWPKMWCCHWVCPLYKKKSVFDPNNYRGLQITSQMSKLVERIIGDLCFPRLIDNGLFGDSQFAYTPKRSARDALLYLVLTWLLCFAQGNRVGLYCSDVSGAFDKVPTERLLQKLGAWAPRKTCFDVVTSWLRPRTARVVAGESSAEMVMKNMVYQSTV